MGGLEAILLALYALASTWFNVQQAGEIGELTVARDQYKAVADKYANNSEHERIDEINAIEQRVAIEKSTGSASSEYYKQLVDLLQMDNLDCLGSDARDLDDGILDAKRRHMEKLRENWGLLP